jgi:uncharacterized protein YegL
MAGEPLEAVEVGVYTMISALKKNPYAIETAFLSIITFDAKARTLVPLTEISAVAPPSLSIRPGTSLGAALDLVRESISRDVKQTTLESKGDFKPMVFIMTDGQPTDDWQGPIARLKAVKPHLAQIYAIGCGDDVDFETLSQIADVCIHNKTLSTESVAKLFVWLSASVQSQSATPESAISLEKKIPLEKGMELINTDSPPKFTGQNKRLSFHVTCLNTKQPYMMRFKLYPGGSFFMADDVVKLPLDFFSDGAMKSPPVDTSLLQGVHICPFCGADGWGKCGFCGHLFCLTPQTPSRIVCPVCETNLALSSNTDSFSIDGSQG